MALSCQHRVETMCLEFNAANTSERNVTRFLDKDTIGGKPSVQTKLGSVGTCNMQPLIRLVMQRK